MKRILTFIISAFLGLVFCTITVYAEESTLSYEESLLSLFQASGMEDLLTEQNMNSMLEEQGMEVDKPETLAAFSITSILENLAQQAVDAAALPLRTFGLLLGVILLSALAESLQSSRASVNNIYEMICVLCAVGIIANPLSNIFLQASERLEASAGFMLQFSVIFASVLTICGGVTAAAGYQAAIIGACEIAMQLAVHVMLPVLSMGLALSIVDAVNPAVSLDGVVKLLHKATVWLLGLLMTVFLGILSLQSMTAVASDKLASKTTKFVISNFIPFVGGAVSDAYSTVMGSMGILKTTTGVIGIVSILSLFLPVLLQLGIYRFLTAAAGAIAELFAVQRLTRLLKNMECIIAAAFSVSVSFSIIFIVSTAIMLTLSGNLISG